MIGFRKNKYFVAKPIWMIIRLLFSIAIYVSIFWQPGFIDQLCGPLAIPVHQNLFFKVITVEIAYFIWPFLVWGCMCSKQNSNLRKIINLKTPKVVFMLMIKIFTIVMYQTQRNKYYLHVTLLEFIILICTILIDILGELKVSDAWEIIMSDSFQKVAIFYEVTRTFCPNLTIYWFIANLLVLIVSQIQAHAFYEYPLSEKLQPVFPQALYVKQDIYRLMIMTMGYFGLYAFLQSRNFGFGMAIVFLLSSVPFFFSIQKIQQNQCKKSLFYIILTCICVILLPIMRVTYPSWFKIFQSSHSRTCGALEFFTH